jgi:VWFA-related protein
VFKQSLQRGLATFFLIVLMTLLCLAQTAASDTYPGVQIEFPESGKLRIENDLGDVTAEIWEEKYVYLTTDQGTNSSKRSSVSIENKERRLLVRVIRPAGETNAPINLTIKVPESAHVEIVTGAARISMRGVPASATIKSVSGDVKVDFLGAADVDLVAKSGRGSVKSEIPQLLSANGHVLQARLGTGVKALGIDTATGNITLSLTNRFDVNGLAAQEDSRVNDSLSTNGQKPAAGTPAPVLDAQEIGEGDVIRVDSQLVTLNLSVVDKNTNRGLLGLTKSDFRLFENGAEQQILQFDSSSAPFDLLLVIDLSGSTREVVKLIRSAALRFVAAARPSDRIGVISFAGQAIVVSPLTLDRQLLRQRISVMNTTGGGTKLYDATDFAVNLSLQDSKNPRRTAIILMSDGLDGSIRGVHAEGSKLSYGQLLNKIREFDGVLYGLWLNTEYEALSPLDTQPEAFDAGHDRMKEIADTGGGVFYEVERLEDLAGAYEKVVADLGTVYSLAYRPSDKTRDGKWRTIRVNVARPAAVARGKRGYYAN